MSQNSNTLMLFFKDQTQHENCVLAIVNLMRGDDAKSQEWQERLGVNLSSHWHQDWFNHEFRAQPEFIKLTFDSSTSCPLPLQLLLSLFEHGLRAAVVEVFHGQVGETERRHFLAGMQVSREELNRHEPSLQQVIVREMGDGDDLNACVNQPIPLSRIIDDERRSEARARETVEGIVTLAKAARESGATPIQLMKGVLMLWAIGKGLLHAVIFTVVALLLFKGVWLWIGLGLLLAVALPLVYALQASSQFGGDHQAGGAQ